MIPYSRQSVNAEDIATVVAALRSDWLTQGPQVEAFEQTLADYCGTRFAVATANGTAALHAAYAALGCGPGDEFITSPITFPATANAGLWQGAKPVFIDCDPDTGLILPDRIPMAITKKTKAIVPVDYTGRPVAYEKITAIARKQNLSVISDACQALGAVFHGQKVGSLADCTVFSFHPVKSITTGEGGAITTNSEEAYRKMKSFVTHGIVRDGFQYAPDGAWYFEMQELGQNYRLTDMQCALGMSQLKRLDAFLDERRRRAARYHEAFVSCLGLRPPAKDSKEAQSAWHLYVVKLIPELARYRGEIFNTLRAKEIGVQIHHIPVYRHPYYQKLGYRAADYPGAEEWYAGILSLPLYPDLTLSEQDYVIEQVLQAVGVYA